MGAPSFGPRIVSLQEKITAGLTDVYSGTTRKARIWDIGDSVQSGGSVLQEAPSGTRQIWQAALTREGIAFDVVGNTGHGDINSGGTTWAVFPVPKDFSSRYPEAYKVTIQSPLHSGMSGRSLVSTSTFTSADASTDRITLAAQVYASGSFACLREEPGGTLPTFAPAANINPFTVFGVRYLFYFAINISGATHQACYAQGGSTPGDITSPGSGPITALAGIGDLIIPMSALLGVDPLTITHVFLNGGGNDMFPAVDAGTPLATIEAMLETRAIYTMDQLDLVVAPSCNKFFMTMLPIAAPATNQANKETARESYNAWMIPYVPRRSKTWAICDCSRPVNSPELQLVDGAHPKAAGAVKLGEEKARCVIASWGPGTLRNRRPAPFTKRVQQGCYVLNGTNQRGTIATSAARDPGANAFWVMLKIFFLDLDSTFRGIVQLGTAAYANGLLLAVQNGILRMYWRNAGPCIPASGYGTMVEPRTWYDLLMFFDINQTPKQVASLWVNANLVQEVRTDGLAAVAGQSWYIGASFADTAHCAYKDLRIGASAIKSLPDGTAIPYTFRDCAEMAHDAYMHNIQPHGMTERFLLETTASELSGASAMTNSSGTFLAAGVLVSPWEQGYINDLATAAASVSVDSTTTSPSFADLLSVSITTGNGSTISIHASMAWNALTTDGSFVATVDGTVVAGVDAAVGNLSGAISIRVSVGVGAHTVALRWKSGTAGTVNVRPQTNPNTEHASLLVAEVR
jgi:lysophospholipase L1-like esterase